MVCAYSVTIVWLMGQYETISTIVPKAEGAHKSFLWLLVYPQIGSVEGGTACQSVLEMYSKSALLLHEVIANMDVIR